MKEMTDYIYDKISIYKSFNDIFIDIIIIMQKQSIVTTFRYQTNSRGPGWPSGPGIKPGFAQKMKSLKGYNLTPTHFYTYKHI